MKYWYFLQFAVISTAGLSYGFKTNTAYFRVVNNIHKLHEFNSNSLSDFQFQYSFIQKLSKCLVLAITIPFLFLSNPVKADDELAKFAAEGNKVGVDGQCFLRKCSIETAKCANDPTCLKGLSCLARCKGASMCSTGCFAKYGSEKLDDILYCSVEKNDCVQVPGKENTGWTEDKLADLPAKPINGFDVKTLDGIWYKVMGLDSRYDCFDCQRNSFVYKGNSLDMEALFRIPRPQYPGYLQNKIVEELHSADSRNSLAHLQSQGQMFGLTFWENWYILGDTNSIPPPLQQYGIPSAYATSLSPELKLVYYTGHTLQGSYKGAFVYSRTPTLDGNILLYASDLIRKAGLNPNDFCAIRNGCFNKSGSKDCSDISQAKQKKSDHNSCKNIDSESDPSKDAPFWYLGQRFFQVTNGIAKELSDWFEDPALLSDWLISQQEHGVLNKPLVRVF